MLCNAVMSDMAGMATGQRAGQKILLAVALCYDCLPAFLPVYKSTRPHPRVEVDVGFTPPRVGEQESLDGRRQEHPPQFPPG